MTRSVYRAAPAAVEPVRQENLRAHNLTLLFHRIVANRGTPISRIELARGTGLTRPTVSRIVDDLLTGGLIVEAGPDRSGGTGRPRVGLQLSRSGPAGLGLDIRVDSLTACVVDLTGKVRYLGFAPRGRGGSERTIKDLAAMARQAIAAAAAEGLTVVGATLAAPGLVRDGSIVRSISGLGWRDVDAGAALRAELGEDGLPIGVDTDASLAALAELYAGDPELRNFACVFGDFDLGTGIVLDGVPLRGVRGWSGQIGHVPVDADGQRCECGAVGCVQRYASLEAILAAVPDAERHAAKRAHQAPAVTISALAESGSPEVLAALERAGTTLGRAIATLVNIVEVDVVLLDGNYSLLAAWLADHVQAQLNSRVLTTTWAPVEVRPAPLGPDAAVIGAALVSVDTVRSNPVSWLERTRA